MNPLAPTTTEMHRTTASNVLGHFWARQDPKVLDVELASARECLAAFSTVTKAAGSLIQGWVRGQVVREYEHYPNDDAVDVRSGSQYFYHAHRSHGTEHGHLHLFWHATASGARRYVAGRPTRWGRTAPTHLFAIGFDSRGLPISLFTVNRWVTDGHWFDAHKTLAMVDRFTVSKMPDYQDNGNWLTRFIRMYRPLVALLLERRDERLAQSRNPIDALDNRRLEVVSSIDIDWAADLDRLESLAAQRRAGTLSLRVP